VFKKLSCHWKKWSWP